MSETTSTPPQQVTIRKLHLDDVVGNLTNIAKALTDIHAWVDPADLPDDCAIGLLAATHKIAEAVHCSLASIAMAVRDAESEEVTR